MRTLAKFLFLVLIFGGMISVFNGCQTGAPSIGQPPSGRQSRDKDLKQIKGRIVSNSQSFVTLKAKVDVALRSGVLQRPPQLQMSGRLALKRSKSPDGAPVTKVYLYLERRGSKLMELIGNGERYRVDLSMTDDSYSNKYGASISKDRNKIHFMPDDLAHALVITDLFYQSSQVLKTYPSRWDMQVGGLQNPITTPPKWVVDSVRVSGDPAPKAWVSSSLVLDPSTERILRLDKFRSDGSLRCSVWYMNQKVLTGPEDKTVRIPGELILWYPPPLESTVIRMRLKDLKVNVSIPDKTFDLKD